MAAELATILIADISGYTELVSKTAIEHSAHLLSHLLDTIVRSADDEFVVSEIEGDAVLFYKKGPPPSKSEIVGQCVRVFGAFHQELANMASVTICRCGACAGTHELTLKFVVHAGTISEIKVSRFVKAAGLDMVIAHRLLKTSLAEREYLLLTNGYLDGVHDRDEHNGLSFSPSREVFDVIGAVDFQFARLEPVRKAMPPPSRAGRAISRDDSLALYTKGTEIEISANYNDVFNAIINIEWRKYYGEGVRDVEPGPPWGFMGSKHVLVYEGARVEIEPMHVEVSDAAIVYGEYHRGPVMSSLREFTVANLGDRLCQLTARILPMPMPMPVPERGRGVPCEIEATALRQTRLTNQKLKAFCENGFVPG